MTDLKTTNMLKDEKIVGWKAQVLALYQSLVILIFGSISFILRLLQEYFKTGEAKWSDEEKPKSKADVGGKASLRSAGEHTVEEGLTQYDESSHTVVDLPAPVVSPVPVVAPAKVEEPIIVEPSLDQSKNTLVIKNLPFKFKPTDLDKLLSEHNAKPKNVRLLRDESGRFSGMAFIRCPSKDEAQRLITSMNGLDIGGRNIQVEFKLKKKKKGKLDASTDSLSSSSDELPGCRLRISSESNEGIPIQQPQPIIVQPAVVQPAVEKVVPTVARGNKLSVSAEHMIPEGNQTQPLKKALFQPRRKSTSSTGEPFHHYINSKLVLNQDNNRLASGIKPVRQPVGPNGTNGFSLEYRRSRGQNV